MFRGFHKALTVRRGYKRVTLATTHKMSRCIYAVLRDNKPYQDPETEYEQLLVRTTRHAGFSSCKSTASSRSQTCPARALSESRPRVRSDRHQGHKPELP